MPSNAAGTGMEMSAECATMESEVTEMRRFACVTFCVVLVVVAAVWGDEGEPADGPRIPVRIRIFISSENHVLIDGVPVKLEEAEKHLASRVPKAERAAVRIRIKAHHAADKGVMLKVAAAARNAKTAATPMIGLVRIAHSFRRFGLCD